MTVCITMDTNGCALSSKQTFNIFARAHLRPEQLNRPTRFAAVPAGYYYSERYCESEIYDLRS
jgi:hypothetical protein